MTTIEDTFGEKMSLTRAAAYLKLDRRLLKRVYRLYGGFDPGDGHLIFFKKGIDDAIQKRITVDRAGCADTTGREEKEPQPPERNQTRSDRVGGGKTKRNSTGRAVPDPHGIIA